jgi:glycosyltransferase involved in cell wall biosynthesis
VAVVTALRTRLRVLHVAAPARFGGLESVLALLAERQAAAGHAVTVALVLEPGDGDHPLSQRLRASGVDVREVLLSARAYLEERRRVRALVAALGADVVHTHGYRPDVVVGGVARALGAATVSTAHGFIDHGLRGRLASWLQLRALRRYDAAIAVSGAIASRLRTARVPASRVHEVPNAFAPASGALDRDAARARLALPSEAFVVGFVGRLSAEKGPDLALDTLAALMRAGDVTTVLAMVGAGPEADALRSRAAALGLGERVRWCGAIADVGRCYAAFDAFLLSSRTEGTPVALLEAVAAGVPAVAARVGGVPAVLGDDGGALVAAADVAGFATALAAVRDDRASADGRAGRAHARLLAQYDVSRWLARHDTIYQQAIADAALRRSRMADQPIRALP